MKRFLCSLIAISLVFSMLPIAFAETAEETPEEKTYMFDYNSTSLGENTLLSEITENKTDSQGRNFYDTYGWRYFPTEGDATACESISSSKSFYAVVSSRATAEDSGNTLIFNTNNGAFRFALMLKAPEVAGFYKPSVTIMAYQTDNNRNVKMYMSKPVAGDNAYDYYDESNLVCSGQSGNWKYAPLSADTAIYAGSNESLVSAISSTNTKHRFKSITLTPVLNPVMSTTSDAGNALSIDLTEDDAASNSQKVTLSTTVSGTDVTDMPVSDNFITYKSSDEAVATVAADGTITAVGGGTATIYAESSDKKYNSQENGITVTVTEPQPVSHVEEYNLWDANGSTSAVLSNYNDTTFSARNWRYFDMSDELAVKELFDNKIARVYPNESNGIYFASSAGVPIKFALSLKAPETSAFYIPVLKWSSDSGNTETSWYFGKQASGEPDVENYITGKSPIASVGPVTGRNQLIEPQTAIYAADGEEIITAISVNSGKTCFFQKITLTQILADEIKATIDGNTAITLNANETATAAVTVTGKTNVNDVEKTITNMPVQNNFITYHSDNTAVATVSADGTITAGNTAGTATITAQSPDGKVKSNEITVTVTAPAEPEEPGEEVTDTKVSVAVQPENTDEGTVSWGGETIGEVNMGDTVSATATAKEGYVFRYWKNSAGQVISDNPNESFVINTNSAITAVFDKVTNDANTVSVELYNANGMPFESKNVEKDTTFEKAISGVGTPTYIGFGAFKHWSMYADASKIADDMLIKENIRAVAIFNAPTEKYTVKVNGAAKHSDVLYGTEVTVSSDATNFSCWKLGEKIVSYEPEYTFTVWGNVDLTEVKEGSVTEAPIATLTTIGSNPLLIYSVPAGYTKIEAGIIFGSTSNINIYSVDGSRAVEARGTGQFTAQPKVNSASDYARGYLIFKNNSTGDIRIIYAD